MSRSKRNICVYQGIGEHAEAYWMALCLADGGKSGIVGGQKRLVHTHHFIFFFFVVRWCGSLSSDTFF